jgi:hypothetical protein
MTATLTAWLIITGLLGLSASIAIWARGASRARGFAVLAFVLATPASALALGMSLGWAIPYWPGITIPEGKHALLGVKMVEGQAIFILLDIGTGEPRYYRLPWSIETAQKLQSAQEGAGEGGEVGVKTPPFDPSPDDLGPMFYADPQEASPPKPAQPEAPHFGGDA